MSGRSHHRRRATSAGRAAAPCCARSPCARAAGTERIEADTLAMSGGWNPELDLTCHHGGRPVWNADIAAFVPGQTPPDMTVGRRSERSHAAARLSHRRQRSGPAGGRGQRASQRPPDDRRARTMRHSPSRRSGTWAAQARLSSISRTTSRPRISRWPSARAFARSSI